MSDPRSGASGNTFNSVGKTRANTHWGPGEGSRSPPPLLNKGAQRRPAGSVHYDFRNTFSAFPDDHLLDVVVLHHEACGVEAIVQVDDAGIRILGRRALNGAGPWWRVEDVQIVGGLLLARGLTAIHEQITARAPVARRSGRRGEDIERIFAVEPENTQGVEVGVVAQGEQRRA